MSRNRILGVPQNTQVLPAASGSFYNESYQDDVLVVPSTAASGAPYCTLRMNGCGGGPTAGAQPADGDRLDVTDAFGVLSASTTLVIQARSGGVGFQIADGDGLVDSITLGTAGATRQFTFSGSANCWVSTAATDSSVDTYDYVVVGLGTSGSILARYLSENMTTSVIALESGENRSTDTIVSSVAFPQGGNLPILANNPKYAIVRTTQPGVPINPTPATPAYPIVAGSGPFSITHGRGWGGCSLHYALIAARGAPAGYDAWATFSGDAQWSYNNLLNIMQFIEAYTPNAADAPLDPAQRGTSGAIKVTEEPALTDGATAPFYTVGVEGALGLNIPFTKDYNDPTLGVIGWGVIQEYCTPDFLSRAYAFDYVPPTVVNPDGSPVGNRKLTVISKATANKVLFDTATTPPTAVGVQYLATDINGNVSTRVVLAKEKVILSAGNIDSPAILQRSGIGDPALLASFGIPVVFANTNVGANMQSHYGVEALLPQIAPITNPFHVSGITALFFGDGSSPNSSQPHSGIRRVEYAMRAGGAPATIPPGFANADSRFSQDFNRLLESVSPAFSFTTQLQMFGILLDTNKLGNVAITSLDPTTPPQINLAFYSDGPAGPDMTLAVDIYKTLADLTLAYTAVATTTTANFTQPDVGDLVVTAVVSNTGFVVGEYVNVVGGGQYTVAAVTGGTGLTLKNTGAVGNAAPATVINFPANVTGALMPTFPPAAHYPASQYGAFGGLAPSNDELKKDCYATSIYLSTPHIVGSCRMAPSAATGVVDANLNVFGVQHLAVCDLSVAPQINSGHTAWPAYVLGVKKAQLEGATIPGL